MGYMLVSLATLHRPCYPSACDPLILNDDAAYSYDAYPDISFLYFYAYSFLRATLQRRVSTASSKPAKVPVSSTPLSVPQELGLGFISGIISRLVTTPLSVITVRLQVENEKDEEGDEEKGGGIIKTFHDIYEEHGIGGFWKGMWSSSQCYNIAD